MGEEISDVEHFSPCHLAIWMCSSEGRQCYLDTTKKAGGSHHQEQQALSNISEENGIGFLERLKSSGNYELWV